MGTTRVKKMTFAENDDFEGLLMEGWGEVCP